MYSHFIPITTGRRNIHFIHDPLGVALLQKSDTLTTFSHTIFFLLHNYRHHRQKEEEDPK
jgi:hypothetical protein